MSKFDVKINNYINGRAKRKERSLIPVDLAIGGGSREGGVDACGKKIY